MENVTEKPLYGHDSEETAYLVKDYPYGHLRCQIKFWLEYREGKGFRFCSRTENPKNGRWNAVKHGTYSMLAANMYLDEKGHCVYSSLSEYNDAEEIIAFFKRFPESKRTLLLKVFAMKHVAAYRVALNKGTEMWGINGNFAPLTPEKRAEYEAKKAAFEEIVNSFTKTTSNE